MQRVVTTIGVVLFGALVAGFPAHASDLVAEPGCWPMRDGGPARTGACATPPLVGELAPAWHFEPKGRFAGQLLCPPRVYREHIAVAVGVSETVANLYVLRLGDGKPLVKPAVLKSRDPLIELDLTFDRRGLLVVETRSSDKVAGRLSVWRVSRGKLRKRWEFESPRSFQDVLRVGETIVALRDGHLLGFRTSDKEPVYDRRGKRPYRGRLSAAGGTVYAITIDKLGNTELIPFHARLGIAQSGTFIGHLHGAPKSTASNLVDIVITRRRLFIHSAGHPFISSKKKLLTTCILERLGHVLNFSTLRGLLGHAVAVPDGWIVRDMDSKNGIELVHRFVEKDNEVGGYLLASRRRHERFARPRVPLTTAGTVVYSGLDAFDLESRDILRESGMALVYRPIPARRTLLVVPERTKLVAMRSATALRGGGVLFQDGQGQMPKDVDKGVVVFSSGDVHKGVYRIDGDDIVVVKKRGKKTKEEREPLGGVRIAIRGDSEVVYVHTIDDLVESLRAFMEGEQAKAYYKLLKDAYKAQNTDLMARYVEIAADRGIDDRDLRHPRKQIGMLRKRSARANEKKSAALRKREAELRAVIPSRIDQALESALNDERPKVREQVLRIVFERNPKHERALGFVTKELPEWLKPKPPFDPLSWLELGEALRGSPVSQVPEPVGDMTIQQRELGQARLDWRKDLVGMQSERLLVLTPLVKPGRITRCVSMGELVCKALESMFDHGKHVRTDPWPMVLHLFASKKGYLKAAGGKRLEWTSGHFDPRARLSRIYLPDRKDAFESVMRTYAHELTHHWIAERCPLFNDREKRRSSGLPGYWIVEGMADFVESFHWDMGEQTWDTFNAKAGCLDIVANAPKDQMHAWDRLFGYSHLDFARLPRDDKIKVSSRWKIGMFSSVSTTSMFYHQAAAAAHYLYHHSPETRAGLTRYVAAVYTSKLKPKDDGIKHFFGMGPNTLGKRVVQYAREVVEGRRTNKK